jgi:uncharacterized protein (DUF1778 family)
MATGKPESKRKGGGGKLARSETVTVRFDPKLRYLLELAARKQRRTVSSFIEWAVEESLKQVVLREDSHSNNGASNLSIADVAAVLWDVDESDRFALLALDYPDMLTHEEQTIWKLVKEHGLFWDGFHGHSFKWEWRVAKDSLRFQILREYWPELQSVARGEAAESSLPNWIPPESFHEL